MRMGLGLAAAGGKSDGKGEGGKRGGEGLGLGHGGLHPVEFKAAVMAAYHSVASARQKVQTYGQGWNWLPRNDKVTQ